jgi:prevent-host-death family protein
MSQVWSQSGENMPKIVSATEAKAKLSAVMNWVTENQDQVIVESRGKPQVAIIPFDEYQELKALKEQKRREAALVRLQQIAADIQANNQDLTEAEIDQLADEITRETIDRMVAEGSVTFKTP